MMFRKQNALMNEFVKGTIIILNRTLTCFKPLGELFNMFLELDLARDPRFETSLQFEPPFVDLKVQ